MKRAKSTLEILCKSHETLPVCTHVNEFILRKKTNGSVHNSKATIEHAWKKGREDNFEQCDFEIDLNKVQFIENK